MVDEAVGLIVAHKSIYRNKQCMPVGRMKQANYAEKHISCGGLLVSAFGIISVASYWVSQASRVIHAPLICQQQTGDKTTTASIWA
jgi:hypothetical protein